MALTKWKEDIAVLSGLLAVCCLSAVSRIGCPLKWLTGVSCAGCGMTRAVLCALRLRFDQAFYYHPLFFLPPICALCWFFREKIPERAKKYMARAAVVCFLAVYLVRLADRECRVVACDVENGFIVRTWNDFRDWGK